MLRGCKLSPERPKGSRKRSERLREFRIVLSERLPE